MKRSSHAFADMVNENNAHGSRYVIDAFKQVTINEASCQPLSGSTYIKLPQYLENKKALINIKNTDNQCFKYCICAHKFKPEKDPQRPTKYTQEMLDSIKTEGVEMPVKACSAVYRKIEKQNDFSFNVYTCELSTAGNYPIYPIYLTNNMKSTHVNLLLYYEDTDEGC